jgi:hypothetical protein
LIGLLVLTVDPFSNYVAEKRKLELMASADGCSVDAGGYSQWRQVGTPDGCRDELRSGELMGQLELVADVLLVY